MTVSIRSLCRMALVAAGLALGTQAQAATATIDCVGGTLSFANNVLTCTPATTGGGDTAPGGCSLTATPGSGSTATHVMLTAACTSGTTPIALAWSGAAGTGSCPTSMAGLSTTCTISGVAASSTWSANFSNSAGSVNRSATFTYTAGGGGTGAFAGCPSDAIKIDGQWGNLDIATANWGTFGNNILSVRIAVPANWTSSSTKTSTWGEYQDGGTYREAVLSTVACDFGTANALKTSGGIPARSVDTLQFSFRYKAGSPTSSIFGLTGGNVYYLNVRNYLWGQPACTSGSCNMRGGLPN